MEDIQRTHVKCEQCGATGDALDNDISYVRRSDRKCPLCGGKLEYQGY